MKVTCPACKKEVPALPDVSVLACPFCDSLIDIFKEADTEAPPVPDDHRPEEAEEETFHTEQNGDFSLLGVIRRNAAGTVYRALRKGTDKMYGLLLFSEQRTSLPDFIERFKSEALELRRLNHSGLIKILGGGVENEKFYLVTEYFNCPHLQNFVKNSGPGVDRLIRLFVDTCDVLAYIHSRGLTHGTLSPFNIFILDPAVKVADAGVAKLALKRIGLSTISSDIWNWEIFNYLAPEQRAKGHLIDHRADIYAVAASFYEALTSEVPAGLFEKPSALNKDLDPRLDEIFARALKRDPEERYRSVANLRTELDELLSKKRTLISTGFKKKGSPLKKAFYLVAAAVVIVALLLSFQYLPSLFRRGSPEPAPAGGNERRQTAPIIKKNNEPA